MAKKSRPTNPARPAVTHPARPGDEVVHVPKGQSPLKYFLILGLMVFVLLIFTVGDQLITVFQKRDPRADAYLTWEHPDEGVQEVGYPEFLEVRRLVDDFYRVQMTPRQFQATADADIAYLILTDALARRAGIAIGDEELRRALLEGSGRSSPFFSAEMYKLARERARVEAPRFETALRMMLRVSRYENLLTVAMGPPSPEEIERLWKEQHQEYSFDLARARAADFADAAGAELLSDEELANWYEDLPEREIAFASEWLPERLSAELAGFPVGGEADAAGLLERYPPPEGEAQDELARSYYDKYRHARFRRDQPLEPDGGDDPAARFYLPFEEVAETARREAAIHQGLAKWLEELRQRLEQGATADLEAEAAELGLAFERQDDPVTQAELGSSEGLAGPFAAAMLVSAGPEGLVRDVVVESDALVVGRVLDRSEAGAPPFEEVRDRVVELWTERKAGELAQAKLEELHAALRPESPEAGAESEAENPVADAETFERKAREHGLEVAHVPWFDPEGKDPLEEEPSGVEDPAAAGETAPDREPAEQGGEAEGAPPEEAAGEGEAAAGAGEPEEAGAAEAGEDQPAAGAGEPQEGQAQVEDEGEVVPATEQERSPSAAAREFLLSAYRGEGTSVFLLEEGAVSAPQPGPEQETWWLARLAGKRDPETVRIEPSDLQMLRQLGVNAAQEELREKVLHPQAYARRYQMRIASGEEPSEPEG